MSGCYRFKLEPPGGTASPEAIPDAAEAKPPAEKPKAKMFAPENAINGFARAIRGIPNSWRPERGKPMPQWIQLDFGRPVEFNCVHVSFQTRLMRADQFRLEAPDGDAWRPVAQISDDLNRRRVIYFDRVTASKLRLVLTKARDDVGVCEIRVYDEAKTPGESR